ncbi:hypothetical protein OG252_44725 [Streptomyces sp. NBC_01352]|uniref:hypothetical protein n=1 Tax=Streptomyces sp. NBC_01352 TaxID=2903834 RepID=UPI002E34BC25|nr:hypothetical protein [Streptomyces sp. NBC_01352]
MSQSGLQRLLESLRTADWIELVRNVAERMPQELIEAELSGRIGAQWNEGDESGASSELHPSEATVRQRR